MSENDWIQLWLLNKLVMYSSTLSRLVDIHDDERSGYWAFPGKAALNATIDTRIGLLYDCVKKGWIDVYLHSLLHDKRFASLRPGLLGECSFRDSLFLDTAEAILTFQGHEKWEEVFQPDWARFWIQSSTSTDANTGEVTLSILYAGDCIIDELLIYLPAYWGLDTKVGLKEIECLTLFQYQATSWKILPCVKEIIWKGQSNLVELNRLYREQNPEIRAQIVKHHMQVQKTEFNLAYRNLTRLSKKWTCV
jgi:hypothetical protein